MAHKLNHLCAFGDRGEIKRLSKEKKKKNSIHQFVRSCGLRSWGRKGGGRTKGDKVYVPSLDHFVPFNCCKCTVINPGNFLVSFTGIKCVCQPPILIFFSPDQNYQTTSSPPFFLRDGRASKTRARAINHFTRERRDAVGLFSRGVIFTRACFSLALLQEQWGTTCSLETTDEIHTLSHTRSLKRFSFQKRVSPFWRLQGVFPEAYASVQ